MKTTTTRWPGLFIIAAALAFPASTWADEMAKEKGTFPDKFQIDIGGFFVTNASTTISLAAKSGALAAGTIIDFHQDLDIPDSDTVGRIDGYYRWGKRSRVDFSYFKINRSGTASAPFDINWGDLPTIPAGTSVSSFFDQEVLKATYGFSFLNERKAELGIDGGLFVSDLSVGLSTASFGSQKADVTAPLPVVGAYFRYEISHRWRFIGKADFFYLQYSSYSGYLTDLRLDVEYHPWKHVGFGFGFNAIQQQLDYDTSNFSGSVKNTIGGPQIYVFTNFGKAKYQD
jgi:hypothetical protein